MGQRVKIIIASTNMGKIKEIKQILSSPKIVLLTFQDFKIDRSQTSSNKKRSAFRVQRSEKIKKVAQNAERGTQNAMLSEGEGWHRKYNWPQLRESGQSFRENAYLKAKKVASYFNLPALADDSGLEVDVLGGAPGVTSARYAGSGANSAKNNRKLLRELKEFPADKRRARFRCVALCFFPDGRVLETEGLCEGSIALAPAGKGGFGYDPLFVPLGKSVTLAELPLQEKNKISHRGKAFRKLRKLLLEEIG